MEKIIHCCWLGNKQMPEDQKQYIQNWKKLMPDFEIRLWDDKSFAPYLGESEFVKECIKQNKPGFLSDFFRFTVLYNFGGIYMDTDVEMLKSFEPFTTHKMFIGYIIDSELGTATIGAEKNNPIIKKMLDKLLTDFDKTHQLIVSNRWVTQFFLDNFPDFKLTGGKQIIGDDILILPKDYLERYCFDPKNGGGYAEHHCYGSWYNRKEDKPKELLKRVFGRKIISRLGHWRALHKSPFYKNYKYFKKHR